MRRSRIYIAVALRVTWDSLARFMSELGCRWTIMGFPFQCSDGFTADPLSPLARTGTRLVKIQNTLCILYKYLIAAPPQSGRRTCPQPDLSYN